MLVEFPRSAEPSRPTDAELARAQPVGSCVRECRGLQSCVEAAAARTPHVSTLFARLAHTLQFDDGAVGRLWPEIELTAQSHAARPTLSEGAFDCLVRRCAATWAEDIGGWHGWAFSIVDGVADDLADAVLGGRQGATASAAVRFQRMLTTLTRRTTDVFPRCAAICPDGSCRHRKSAASVANTIAPRFASIAFGAAARRVSRPQQAWVAAVDPSVQRIEFPSAFALPSTRQRLGQAATAFSLCVAQQCAVDSEAGSFEERLAFLDNVLEVAPKITSPSATAARADAVEVPADNAPEQANER